MYFHIILFELSIPIIYKKIEKNQQKSKGICY